MDGQNGTYPQQEGELDGKQETREGTGTKKMMPPMTNYSSSLMMMMMPTDPSGSDDGDGDGDDDGDEP